MLLLLHTFLSLVTLSFCRGHNQFLSSVSGEVGKGNFTYHSMTHDGTIVLQLISTSGDCDLYVSEKTLNPGYEPNDNCLQSATCGTDTVMVPKSFKRPVGIGIYGHPSHELSSYILISYLTEDSQDLLHYDSYDEVHQSHIGRKSKGPFPRQSAQAGERNLFPFRFNINLQTLLQFPFELLLEILL